MTESRAARRLERAVADTRGIGDLRPTIVRGAISAFLSLLVYGIADYPSGALGIWLGLVTLIVGFAIALLLEFAVNLLLADGRNAQDALRTLQPELAALRSNQADVESLRRQGERQQAAYEEQIATTRQTLVRVQAHHAAHTEVMWGVLREQNAGVHVPVEAIVARLTLAMKAAGVEMPEPRR
jgi:hypothetical protein